MTRPRTRLGFVLLAALLAALLGASCGGDDGGGGGGDADAAAEEAAAQCPGEPLRFTTIAAITSPITGGAGERARIGIDAAVNAVNRECSLGRPIEVHFCDDAGNVNDNLACGREAAEDGSLAILGGVGSFDDGAAASGLPVIFAWGTSAFELTNENAYSSRSAITVGMASASAVAARGGDEYLMVLADTPALQFAATQVVQLGELIDVDVEVLYYPQDTTDFAPVAAQIAERDPEAVGILPANPVVMVNALAAEGITPQSQPLVTVSIVLTPETVEEMGDAADGMLVISPVLPPTATENEGIAEFRADLEANGQDPDAPDIDFGTVISWSNIKMLEGALLAAGPEVIESLTPETLVEAIVEHPIDRPEIVSYDFREHQIPELPDLAGFRVFTRDIAILELRDGRYEVLSDGFIDILDPPDIG